MYSFTEDYIYEARPISYLLFVSFSGEDLSKDGGVMKHLVREGQGHATPNNGATVTSK